MKMRIIFTLLITLSIFFTVQSQSKCDCYERLSKLAGLKFQENKPDSALFFYRKAFSFLPENSKDKFDFSTMALYFSSNNIIDSASYYAKKAIINGYKVDYFLRNSNFKPLTSSSFWAEVKDTKFSFNTFNWEFYNAIKEMTGIDQAIRDESKLGKWANDSIYYSVDSINFYSVKELIELYGFPTVQTHGFHFNEIMIFLIHASMYSDHMFEDVLDVLYEANSMYICDKSFIATFIDRRLLWHKNQKQNTGTWNKAKAFNPINDIQKIDSLRFSFNLLNLNDYGNLMNLELPEGYIKTDYPANYFCY